MIWEPHNYQINAVNWGIQEPYFAYFLDPGLGKTSIILKLFSHLKEIKEVKSMLIVAPLRPCYITWPGEINKWDDFQDLTFRVLHGTNKNNMLMKGKVDIYIINPEGLEWYFLCAHKIFQPDMLVIDESTKFKSSKAKRFKLLKSKLDLFKRRYILTGTPAPNSLKDLFSQFYLLDKGAALTPFITRFLAKWFIPIPPFGFDYKPKEGAAEEIYSLIAPLSLRLDSEDYLELPELIKTYIKVVLPPSVMKTYKQMEDQFLTITNGSLVVADNAAAASSKCRQLANGAFYTEDEEGERSGFNVLHDAKLEALEDLIEELNGKPLLVAYEFNHDLERLLNKFGKDTPYIGKGVNEKKTVEIVSAWNKGRIKLLLGQPQSMSHGLNMQGSGGHICWFTPTWNLENYIQFNRRLWRQGVRNNVHCYHLIAAGTIDELVVKATNKKDVSQNTLLQALTDLKTERAL